MQRYPGANFYVIKDSMDTYYANRDKGRGSGFKQYMRWAERVESYVYPSGEMYNYNARTMQAFRRFQKTAKYEHRSVHGHWTELGPDSYSGGWGNTPGNGRINCISFHPADPDIFYVGAPTGGLWKTIDGGGSWTCLTDMIPAVGVSGLAIDYTNTNILYLLTGDGDDLDCPSIGVLKSIDGGQTWRKTGLTWTIGFVNTYKIRIHPTNPNILFVASSVGIIRTIDAGTTWDTVKIGHFTDIEFKPGDLNVMYAVSKQFYRSADGGLSWIEDDDMDFPVDSTYVRIEMAVSPDEPDWVYLLFGGPPGGMNSGNPGVFSGLFLSTDSGGEFYLRSDTPNILGWESDGTGSGNQASYDLAIAADPADATTIFVGGIDIWKSDDGGNNWTIKAHWNEPDNSIGYVHADIHALEFDNGNLYSASDGGIYLTEDGGENWDNLTAGISIMQFHDIDVESGVYVGGTQDNGSNDWSSGQTVANHPVGGDGFDCFIDPTNTNIRYYSSSNYKYKSIDGGYSVMQVGPGLMGYVGSDWIINPVNPAISYLAKLDIYRNANAANLVQWIQLFTPFTKRVMYLAQSAADPDVLYASDVETIKYSANINDTFPLPSWTDITAGLPMGASIREIAVDQNDEQRLWVITGGLTDGQKVFFSPDTGQNWINISGSLPNIIYSCLVHQPGSNDGLYLGSEFGVFYRNNAIGDWIFFSNGLPTTRVYDLDIEGNQVYAGNHGRGLWVSDLYTSCPQTEVLNQANDPGNPNHTGMQRYHANGWVTSSRIITGGVGTDVIYTAGDSVVLENGFHARKDNIFAAKLGGCPE